MADRAEPEPQRIWQDKADSSTLDTVLEDIYAREEVPNNEQRQLLGTFDVASHIRGMGVSIVLAVVSTIGHSVGTEIPEACLPVIPTACTCDGLHPLAQENHAA